jgi:hypothetical protein
MTLEEINTMKYRVCCPMCDNKKCVRGTDSCEAEQWAKSKALGQEPVDYNTQYENYLKKSEVVISQLRADRDKLLKALDDIRTEIEKLQTYKMFVGEDTVYIERSDVLAIIDKYKTESEGTDGDNN